MPERGWLGLRLGLVQEVIAMTNTATVRDVTLTFNGLRFHYCDWGDPVAPPHTSSVC